MTYKEVQEEEIGKFSKGYYSFRFEYTDKLGKRRYEVGCWNDGMAPEEALKHITRYVGEFDDGEITDFIDNQFFKSHLLSAMQRSALAVIGEVRRKCEGMKQTCQECEWREGEIGYPSKCGHCDEMQGFNSCLSTLTKSLDEIEKELTAKPPTTGKTE